MRRLCFRLHHASLRQSFLALLRLCYHHMLLVAFVWLLLTGSYKQFRDANLPKHDETIVLVDEDGQEFNTKFLVGKIGLSGGWRGFSIAHKLLEGDVLIFQLIEHSKFKVYIVRVHGLNEIDGALGLLNLIPSGMNVVNDTSILRY
ncbi:B3 DNA binding domain-containing protein [Artemisia annua]|uniref:B3 DNA binding domain-containing protein n=1 Tax=Artemisia annua TaxID=35608 RepID=A0A2U1KH99_ARTAN|nr:B3 DNA binding domain-containing protein [Artemisia annua]